MKGIIMKNTLHTTKMMGFVMILLSAMTLLSAEEQSSPKDWSVGSVSGNPKLEITVRGYPDTIQLGDSVYLICTFKNVGDEVIDGIEVGYQNNFSDYRRRLFQCDIVTNDGNVYENLPEDEGGRRNVRRAPTPTAPLSPGESRVMYVHTFEFPPLEDIRHPLWEELSEKLKTDSVKCTMRFTTKKAYYSGPEIMERILYHDIVIKPRQQQEMDLLSQWLDQAKQEHLPIVNSGYEDEIPRFKYPFFPPDRSETSRENRFSVTGYGISICSSKHNPWLFIRLGNRKPPAHLCPTTWQGWKELEESLTPSTMRDEIRLTRILIQYCDTKDEKVLEELKAWFAGMNEVQRACMAKSVYDRVYGCRGNNNDALLVPFGDLYRAIHEYDISFKPEYDAGFVKNLLGQDE